MAVGRWHWLGRWPLPNDHEHRALRKNSPSVGVENNWGQININFVNQFG
jgi:hypothetical protein